MYERLFQIQRPHKMFAFKKSLCFSLHLVLLWWNILRNTYRTQITTYFGFHYFHLGRYIMLLTSTFYS